MSIVIGEEKLIPFPDVGRVLEEMGAGGAVHTSTVYRWADRGVKGIKLEFIQRGGTRHTSKEALQRFFDRGTEDNSPIVVAPPSTASSRRAVKQALFQLGVKPKPAISPLT